MSVRTIKAIHCPSSCEWACEYDTHPLTGAFFRMKGLLGRSSMASRTAIWLNPCNSIHMFFMKFPIDVVFLSEDLCVVKIYRAIQPWRVTPLIWGAKSCLEMPARDATGITEGDVFAMDYGLGK